MRDEADQCCWGSHLSGCRAACAPGFSLTGGHMCQKFCSACVKVGVPIPAAHIRALWDYQHAQYVNSHGRSPWSSGGWRVVNNTKRCHGPHLIIFKKPAPSTVEWAPMPSEWMSGDDAQHGSFVRLLCKNGTLCPSTDLLPRFVASSAGVIGQSALGTLTCIGLPVPNAKKRGRASSDGCISASDSSGSGSIALTHATTHVTADGTLPNAALTPHTADDPCPSGPAAIQCDLCHPPGSTLLAVVTSTAAASAEPPSAQFLWHAFDQLHRMVRARLENDRGTPPLAWPSAAVPQAAVPQAAVPQAAVPQAPVPQAPVPQAPVPQAPVLQAPVMHQESAREGAGLHDLLAAIENATAILVSIAAPAPAVPPPAVPSSTLPRLQPADLRPREAAAVSDPPRCSEAAGAAGAEAEIEISANELDMWLASLQSCPPSPPTSAPDVPPPRAAASDSPAKRAAADAISFLLFWWYETAPSPILPTCTSPRSHGSEQSWFGLTRHGTMLSMTSPSTRTLKSSPLLAALPVGALSSTAIFYLMHYVDWDVRERAQQLLS